MAGHVNTPPRFLGEWQNFQIGAGFTENIFLQTAIDDEGDLLIHDLLITRVSEPDAKTISFFDYEFWENFPFVSLNSNGQNLEDLQALFASDEGGAQFTIRPTKSSKGVYLVV